MLNPLRLTAGTHQISLRLQPEGLGMVNATVTAQSGHITVELAADNPTGQQTLSSALPDLRQQLTSGGQQATVFLSDSGSGSQGRQSYPGATPSGVTEEVELGGPSSLSVVAAIGSRASSSVDIRL